MTVMGHRPTSEWSFDRPTADARMRGYVVLTFRIREDDGYFVGECTELDVSSFGTTVDEALRATGEAVCAYLDGLDDVDERERVFAERGITMYQTEPADDVDIKVLAHPGEIISAQRIAELADA